MTLTTIQPAESLLEARQDLDPTKRLHYVMSWADTQAIARLETNGVITRVLTNQLLATIKLIGKAMCAACLPGEMSLRDVREMLHAQMSAPTARRHLALLEQAGVVRIASRSLTLCFFADLQPDKLDPFWAKRRAHQRSKDAARQAKSRAQKRKLFSFSSEEKPMISVPCEDVTRMPLHASPVDVSTQTNPAASSAPAVEVETPQSQLPARASFVRASTPTWTDAELDEIAQLGAPSPAEEPTAEEALDAMDPELAATLERLRSHIDAPAPEPQPVKAAPSQPAAQAKPSPAAPRVAIPRLRDLVETHRETLGESRIALHAIASLGADYDLTRQALDITVEALKASRRGKRNRIDNVGGFMAGTIKKLQRGWGGAACSLKMRPSR